MEVAESSAHRGTVEHGDAGHIKVDRKKDELTVVVPKGAAGVAKRIPILAGEKSKS